MSELRKAAQAALTAYETFRDVDDIDGLDDAIDRLRAALAQPESPPHAYLLKKLAMVMPLFEEARDALTAISEQQRAVRRISPTLADRMDMAGTYSIDDWRDVTPPTEAPIAAKCQRIEGSGEICGLTPPCPDCGSSLIDVPEGSL